MLWYPTLSVDITNQLSLWPIENDKVDIPFLGSLNDFNNGKLSKSVVGKKNEDKKNNDDINSDSNEKFKNVA